MINNSGLCPFSTPLRRTCAAVSHVVFSAADGGAVVHTRLPGCHPDPRLRAFRIRLISGASPLRPVLPYFNSGRAACTIRLLPSRLCPPPPAAASVLRPAADPTARLPSLRGTFRGSGSGEAAAGIVFLPMTHHLWRSGVGHSYHIATSPMGRTTARSRSRRRVRSEEKHIPKFLRQTHAGTSSCTTAGAGLNRRPGSWEWQTLTWWPAV